MNLECAESIGADVATEADIRRAFADDYGRGEFIILSASDDVFLQAAGECADPYTLEYREGEHQYRCVRELTKSETEAAFLKYLKGDASWKSDFEWERLELRRWWKFW